MVIFCASLGMRESQGAPVDIQDIADLPLEALMEIEVPTVYSASRFEQKVTAAPSAITIITSEEIKLQGHRTLADVLRSVPGFHVSYDRNYAILGTRGVSLGDFNSRILLLVNGHRLNNNLTDGALIDSAVALDIDLIERVEIIRGPGSVLYGNNAFFGVINVITRSPDQVDGAEVSGEYGTFDSFKARVTVGKELKNGLKFLLSGTFYDSGGEDRLFYRQFNTPDQNNGVAENLDADRYGSFFGSVSFRDFSLEGAYSRREKENPTAQFFTTFNRSGLETVDERAYAALKYAHSFEDVFDVTARAYYDRNDFEIGYPVTSAFSTNLFLEQQAGEWWGTEVQLSRRVWDRHTVILGAEYRDDFRQDRVLFDAAGGAPFTDVSSDRQSYGVYLQTDFEIRTNLHLSAGVRYDKYGDTDPRWNPRFAAIYNPWKGSAFKAIYGTAFRTPNFRELSDPAFQDIEPEKIAAYELIYEQEITRNLRSSVSVYWNEMDDIIAFQSGAFTNFDAQARGMELALDGLWAGGWRTRVSYSLQQAEDKESNDRLPDSPDHLIKLNVSVPLIEEKLFASLEFQYVSSRHSLFTTSTSETVRGQDAAGYGILNFTLFSRNLVDNLEASASIYNLLDRKFSDPSSRFHQQDLIEQDGRSFRLKLTYRF